MTFLLVTLAATVACYLMAEKRGRDVRWAIVGGLLFGWLAALYYWIKGDTTELRIKKASSQKLPL